MTEKPSCILSARMLPGCFSSVWKGSAIRRRKRCDGITCRTAGGWKHQYLPDEVMNRNYPDQTERPRIRLSGSKTPRNSRAGGFCVSEISF